VNLSTLGPLLLGAAGLIGALSAAVTGIRGLRQTGRTQSAATLLAERVQALTELESVVTRLRDEITRLEGLNDRDRLRHERALAETQVELDEQAGRCARQIRLVVEAMETLRSVVVDEIARAAASTAIQRANGHAAEHALRPDHTPPEGITA
jgi:hypothetical protein